MQKVISRISMCSQNQPLNNLLKNFSQIHSNIIQKTAYQDNKQDLIYNMGSIFQNVKNLLLDLLDIYKFENLTEEEKMEMNKKQFEFKNGIQENHDKIHQLSISQQQLEEKFQTECAKEEKNEEQIILIEKELFQIQQTIYKKYDEIRNLELQSHQFYPKSGKNNNHQAIQQKVQDILMVYEIVIIQSNDEIKELIQKSKQYMNENSVSVDFAKNTTYIFNDILQLSIKIFNKLKAIRNQNNMYFYNPQDNNEFNENLFGIYVNSIVSLVNKDVENIDDEFYYMFQLNQSQVKAVKEIFKFVKINANSPVELLEKKKQDALNYARQKIDHPYFKQLDKIKDKLENQALQPRDLFRIVDQDVNKQISMQEFQIYFKKMGIDMSEHRIYEIFSSIKQSTGDENSPLTLNEDEFVKAYEYIQDQSMYISLEQLGISKNKLYFILIFLIFLLLLIFCFIYIGVLAFAVPGTFGAIINSLFPAGAGIGLSRSQESNPQKKINLDQITQKVKETIETIQNQI
ncbi:hypothetical protein PPERSA_11198 [Pseudocohnilembus persalinus]|uniref:EF-hand domain-containing protein n=1 Tax=Pseudocohnilembus persalinus TaxID=266149 RepID=A0A0V0QZK2_PSEPJ|nr:hypothetical protein PPERSA_11198 [Pseudocohnilembus persalinus]|eukprot:KRX07649.1 hypothetical protein PPERSA_11198 [Pseudocohnilembus persalinus]